MWSRCPHTPKPRRIAKCHREDGRVFPNSRPCLLKAPLHMVAKLEKDWPALRSQVTARPNVCGQWVITPRTEEAFNTLSQTCLTQLRSPEEKITKYILLHYPMEMTLCHIQAVDGVQKATRCTTKDGSPTRQVEVHLTGAKREHLDLGLWGGFKLRLFKKEPMRCFRCQRFGHHKATCHNPECCAICSGRHATSVCIKMHKEGQVTTARYVNYKGNHHAWNPKCPERLRLIQTEQRQATTQPRRERAATDNLGNCPLNLRNVKNRLLCGNLKRSSQASANPQATKGEKATKTKKTHQYRGAAIKFRQVPLWRKILAGRGKARHIS